jgi:hypothetical protein
MVDNRCIIGINVNIKEASMPVKKVTQKKAPAKGEKLVCETCGLGVVVDEVSGVVLFEELICCGKPMKSKKTPSKKAPTTKKTTTVKK